MQEDVRGQQRACVWASFWDTWENKCHKKPSASEIILIVILFSLQRARMSTVGLYNKNNTNDNLVNMHTKLKETSSRRWTPLLLNVMLSCPVVFFVWAALTSWQTCRCHEWCVCHLQDTEGETYTDSHGYSQCWYCRCVLSHSLQQPRIHV